ncbi:MAG: SRPBCC family protein [Candidatus Dormiibacterota bacterium]
MANATATEFIIEPGVQEIVMTRVFDAPRELVFKVVNDPEMRAQWWGPARLDTKVEKMDVRHGGAWRITQTDTDGTVHAFRGVYHTVEAPSYTVNTFEYEGVPGHVAMETATFDEVEGGKTRLTVRSVFQSLEDRDGMVSSGMESGASEGWDRLAELVAKAK